MQSAQKTGGLLYAALGLGLGAFFLFFASCNSSSEIVTYWRPVEKTAGNYSNQDGVACFEFRHPSGTVLTLYLTQDTKCYLHCEFLVPKNSRLKITNPSFEVENSTGTVTTVKVAEMVILDESLNRTIAIPIDREIIGATRWAVMEARRYKYCSFTTESFQISSETVAIALPTIRINGSNWDLPKLLLEKHTGKVSRSFSP